VAIVYALNLEEIPGTLSNFILHAFVEDESAGHFDVRQSLNDILLDCGVLALYPARV